MNKFKLIFYIGYLVLGITVGVQVLNFTPTPLPNNDEILAYYPSLAISLPLGYFPIIIVGILRNFGFEVLPISGYAYRFHFFLLSFMLGLFQYIYLAPQIWSWVKKKR